MVVDERVRNSTAFLILSQKVLNSLYSNHIVIIISVGISNLLLHSC